jgi:GntR family transcriptional regulator/MocR family aminotransferase
MPKYLEIYEELKKDITDGIYQNGGKIPGKRTMADNKGVSVITVEHAYELLTEEGYIESRERSGYYVIYSAGDFFPGAYSGHTPALGRTVFEEEKENTASDSSGSFSPSIYAKTARKVLSDNPKAVMEKSPAFGNESLRMVLSEYLLRSRHIKAEPDQILIGAGAEYLYGVIVRTLGRDMIYGIESPGYQRIEQTYQDDGARIELLPLGKDGIKSNSLWNTKARVLHITPYRSFPTGVTASAGKKAEYLKWSTSVNGILVEDDFESEFTPSRKAEDTLFSLDKTGSVLYINTFTKTIGPSVRIAYLLIPRKLLNLFKERVGDYACPVPTLDQLILAELIENGDFERHINRVRRQNRINRMKKEKK